MKDTEMIRSDSSENTAVSADISNTADHDSGKIARNADTATAKDKKRSQNTTLMTEGSIFKNILFFSIPLILGNLLQQMYNAVDSIIVGNYVGSNALAAVGAGTSLINLLIAFSQGAAVGAGVVISQYLGADDSKNIRRAVHTSVAIAIILGLFLTVAGITGSRTLLIMMNTPAEVLDDAACYLQLFSGGLIFNVLYNMAAGILNSAGNSRRPLIYLGAAALTNVVMDLLLIVGLNMGVAGAAIATDISQAVSCLLAIIFLVRVPDDYRVIPREIRIDMRMMTRVVKIGLPTGIQNMVISFSNILLQSSVNGFGAAAMAGFSAYLKIDGFNILPVMSFSMAATTFVGQNYGAGKIDRLKKGITATVIMTEVFTIISGPLLLLNSEFVIGLFTSDPEVIRYGQIAMKYFCAFYWLLGPLHGLGGAVRGTGHSIPPMVILLVSLCLFRIVWILAVLPFFDTIDGVFVLYPISWCLGAVLMSLYFFKGRWLVDHSKLG